MSTRHAQAAQIELLDQLGCHIVPGFYFGRPTSAEELATRLTFSWGESAK
jgi:EAL domain-containing protein (putative c-di-GMP-specific phosphodiesterase class I)